MCENITTMSNVKAVQLYSAWFCPFAQRAWIALLEKNVDFQYIETDPYNKTPEFLAVSPRGLVPSIIHNGRPVYESNICVEYVDEVWKKESNFLPEDPYARAMARIWADFISKKIIPLFYVILQRQTKEEQELGKVQFLKNLETLIAAMSDKGPFFQGETFGFVDIVLVPFTLRLDVLHYYRDFRVPAEGIFNRFHQWMEAAHSRESVKATTPEREKMLAIYERYATNTAKSEVAEAIRKGTPLP